MESIFLYFIRQQTGLREGHKQYYTIHIGLAYKKGNIIVPKIPECITLPQARGMGYEALLSSQEPSQTLSVVTEQT